MQCDEAIGGLDKKRHLRKLALGHARVEIVAAEDVFKIFHAVDFMDTFLRADDEADMIPFADGFGGVKDFAGRGIHRRLI